jgi:hypothetical protein
MSGMGGGYWNGVTTLLKPGGAEGKWSRFSNNAAEHWGASRFTS